MNDTNLGARQKKILEVLQKNRNVSRQELTDRAAEKSNFSRITFIRDLNHLMAGHWVKRLGKGRNTRYRLIESNPLLTYVDPKRYFETDFEQRKIRTGFNLGVLKDLKSLYNKKEISFWEKGRKKLEEASRQLDPSIYKRELERFVIELSWKSSQLEGNTYSLLETETLIKQNIRAAGHPEEEAQMILNHQKAFEVILAKRKSFKTVNLTEVVQLHQVLTQGLVTSGVRAQKVRISGTKYEPLFGRGEIEAALRSIIDRINILKYPPEKALVAAIMIAYLQPFADGNKRTSRMLSNAILLAFGYFPLSYRSVDVNEYRSAMIIFYETNNLYNFKRLYVKQLQFAMENYFQL